MVGFNKKMMESRKKYEGEEHPVDKIGYKLRAYHLADLHMIKHARVIGIYSRIEFVPWEKLPEQFIIKPQRGCSTKGVMPLVKRWDKVYLDILRNKLLSIEEIIDFYTEGLSPTAVEKHSRELWIEELLINPLPCDWKVHTFNGQIGIIEQFKRDEKTKYHKYWTREWINIPNICSKIFTYEINNDLPSPLHPGEILETAIELSKAIAHPYVRIDLYDIPKGVYLGELTPHPGRTCVYLDYWERYLGAMWEQAEEELK